MLIFAISFATAPVGSVIEATNRVSMAKKSTSAGASAAAKDKKNKGAAQKKAVPKQNATTEEDEPPQLPLVLRILIIGVTSYVAEKIWTNRKVVSEVWFAGNHSETQSTMITVFEYLGAMGMLFIVGIVVGILMTRAAAYFPKF